MESLLPALQQVIADMADAKQNWLREWENSTVQLAARMAEKIIQRELQHEPALTLTQVREALALAMGVGHVRILLNPNDFNTLGEQVDRLVKEFNRVGKAEIISDATIQLGGCKVLTQNGEIDLQIREQLDRIVSELTTSNEK